MSSRHQLFLRSPSPSPSLNRRQPLLHRHTHSSSSFPSTSAVAKPPSSPAACCSGRFGEVAGGTTAECAAVCCCCPCGLVTLLVLTIYKVPAGLCREALRRKRRAKLIKKGLLPPRASRRCECGCDDTEIQMHAAGSERVVYDLYGYDSSNYDSFGKKELLYCGIREEGEDRGVEAMVELEKEMWETFYGTGFWRSPSQREQVPPLPPPPSAVATKARRIVAVPCTSSPTKAKLL